MEISIIMPVYNSEKYLAASLDSILNQSFQDFEIICINDGSIDRSKEILEQYIENHGNRIKLISIENGGQANARNIGITCAKGEYITFVDSDDELEEKALEKLYKKAKESEADLIICDIDRIFTQNNKVTKKFQFDTDFTIHGVTKIEQYPDIICYLHGAPYGKLIKRDFLVQNHIEFLKGYIYEDQVFTQCLLSNDPTIAQVKEKLYRYYVRENSTMTSKSSKVTDMFVAYDYIYAAYKKKNLEQKYRKELEYLCLYHVMIGTSFRMWSSKQYSLFSALKKCKEYVRSFGFGKHNEYLKKKGIISVLFVKLFA